MEPKTKYVANLQRVGSAVTEMIALLSVFENTGSWDAVRRQAFQENLLRKGSSHTVEFILREAKRRFFDSSLGLPPPQQAGGFFTKNISETAKEQVIFVYLCESDPLVKRIVLFLVLPRIEGSKPKVTLHEIMAFLKQEAASHRELVHWTEYLKKRWAWGMLAVLRDYGFMEPAPSQVLKAPLVKPETFMFFAQWLIDTGLSSTRLIQHPLWRLFLLSQSRVEDLLIDANRRGWLSYSRAGDVLEIRAQFSSLEMWLRHGLE
jgi:hypothetical protein